MDAPDPLAGFRDQADVIREVARLGDREEAAAMLRAHVDRGGDSSGLADVAFELRDLPTLRRLADRHEYAGERLAELLIADHGVEVAEERFGKLPEMSGERWWSSSPRRLQFAVALRRSQRHQLALAVAGEVLAAAAPDSRAAFGAKLLLTDVHEALGDLDAVRKLVESGFDSARPALFRLLGAREDLPALLAYANGDRRAMEAYLDVLSRRGDAAALGRHADAGDEAAARRLSALLVSRDEWDRLAELAEAGNRSAQSTLAARAADRNDVEALRRLAARGYADAAGWHLTVLERRGDTTALRALAERGDPQAYFRLVELLVRQGDVRGLRRLATAFASDDAAWALASLLARTGRGEQAATVLRGLLPRDLDARERHAADHLIDQLDILRLSLFLLQRQTGDTPVAGAIPFEAVEWIVVAVSAGVLGNAGYAGIVAAISQLWRRTIASRAATAVPGADDAPAPAPVQRTEREALSIACLAVHEHCVAVDATVPDFASLRYEAINDSDGRWVFNLREPDGRRFMVRVPPPRPSTAKVVVTMYVTSDGVVRPK